MRDNQGFSRVPEQPVTPVQTETPVQPENQVEKQPIEIVEKKVEIPVEQEGQPIIQDFTLNPVPATALKKFFALLMTVIILGGSAYGGYQYYLSTQKDKPADEDIEETTTTEVYTTKADVKPYVSVLSEMKSQQNNQSTFLNTNQKGFEEIRLSYPENCTQTDTDLTYTLANGVKLKYQCTKYKEDGEDQVEFIGKVEDKHDFNIKMIRVCGGHEFYASKDGFMDVSHGCVGPWMSLKYTYKDTTKEIHSILFQTKYNGTPMQVPPIVDGYNVYYVTTLNKENHNDEEFKSQYCELTELNIKANSSRVIETFECNYENEDV